MKKLYWKTFSSEKRDLVLLHGWGLNAEVWRNIVPRLVPHFSLHLVDLPGYGRSKGYPPQSCEEMVNTLLPMLPARAVILGWSMGGLIACRLAIQCPEQVAGVITVASSPCFVARQGWPGIAPQTLLHFQRQLSEDFEQTVMRFLALQVAGVRGGHDDVRRLKNSLLSQPFPSVAVLESGLEMLRHSDLRETLSRCAVPLLRLYGRLDGLVPHRVASLLDNAWPASSSCVIDKAAHAPFLSHPECFCQQIVRFSRTCPP